ncbi:MAG TPA: hypothetical protein VGA84_12205 [Thermoanaerobaculia bacterium]
MKKTLLALLVAAIVSPLFAAGPYSPTEAEPSFDEDAVATNAGRWLFRHWNMK